MPEQEKKQDTFVIGVIDNYVKEISGNWKAFFVTGLLFLAFGLIFLIWPEKTIVFIAYTIGLMAIITGVWIIGNAFRIKRIEKNYQKMKDKIKSNFFE
jgi:uncharacterized membrane protein HdeD (DUF308 family)